jgi:hypothetical protein
VTALSLNRNRPNRPNVPPGFSGEPFKTVLKPIFTFFHQFFRGRHLGNESEESESTRPTHAKVFN